MESPHKLRQYIPAFEKKLNSINVAELSAELFCRRYLEHLLRHKRYYLHIYVEVLELLLKNSPQKKEQVVLIDYGAGNGLLGLFAKFCGFYKVYINDFNESFSDSGRELSGVLNIQIDGIITGDIESIESYSFPEKPTAVTGTDVIEHIYNLQTYFKTLKRINPAMVSVFTTASNPYNFYKIKQLQKLQIKDEYSGGTPADYAFFGEGATEPFIIIREKIIKKNFPSVPAHDVLELAELTRGLKESDIIISVKRFIEQKIKPVALLHPTNTCDPNSGSWTERILSVKEYREIYNDAGFELQIQNGFYNEYSGGAKTVVLKLANLMIKLFGKSISPFISLVGAEKN